MAVLTQIASTAADVLLNLPGYHMATGHPWRFLGLLALEEVTDKAVQETQIVIDFLIPLELFRFLRREFGLLLLAQQCRDPFLHGGAGTEDRYPFLKFKTNSPFDGECRRETLQPGEREYRECRHCESPPPFPGVSCSKAHRHLTALEAIVA
jgi:hypothetical protein